MFIVHPQQVQEIMQERYRKAEHARLVTLAKKAASYEGGLALFRKALRGWRLRLASLASFLRPIAGERTALQTDPAADCPCTV